METLQQFHDAKPDRPYGNYKGDFVGECVSLIQQMLIKVYGMSPSAWGNAVDYRLGGTGGDHLTDKFTWHTGTDFKNGDILVWGDDPGNWTGVNGHIAYWWNGKIVNQNYDGNKNVTENAFFLPGFIGYWRPKEVPMSQQSATEREVDNVYLGTLHRHVDPTGKKGNVGKPIDTIITNVRNSPEWKAQDALMKSVPALKKQISDLQKQLRTMPQDTSDAEKKLKAIRDALGID